MTESKWLDIFRNNLYEVMKERNVTQRELAYRSGLSEATISSYMHKTKMPSIRAVINISYALYVDVSDLIDFGDSIN